MKYDDLLNEFYKNVSPDVVNLYKELANKAIELGYNPIRDKTKCFSISFHNNKNKQTIMKFAEEGKGEYFWRFKFAAYKNYSKIFDESIKQQMEKNNFEFAKCFKCKKCVNDTKLNYTIKYDDGRKYWVCGLAFFIMIKVITKEVVDEAVEMMKVQHGVYMKNK